MSEPEAKAAPSRLLSLDAYRGFVMLLMASDGLGFGRVAEQFKDSRFWQFLAYQTEHVEWRGCALWDLIQPSFMFLVGVAMPFSLASRRAKGQTFGAMFAHALWRAFLLAAIGIFLRSVGKQQTNFTFEDVLTLIGLGYVFLFLMAWTSPRVQFAGVVAILLLYWLAFALYPLPPAGFDYKSVGVPENWNHLQGFAAHWDKNTNLAAAFDQWFLNLFPRAKPFVFNGGGYLTLSFIPSLSTMLIGLLCGNVLRSPRSPEARVKTLLIASATGFILGTLLDQTGIAPSVKRIWSPGWVLFSTGWTCLFLAFFYGVVDARGQRWWTFPLVVVGTNSIAMYCMAHLWDRFLAESLRIHLGRNVFDIFGTPYAPIVQHAAVLGILWLFCLWMYRRKLFLRV